MLGSEKHDAIFDRVRYLISIKGGITYIFFHFFLNFACKKNIGFANVITNVKSSLNKDKNHYY